MPRTGDATADPSIVWFGLGIVAATIAVLLLLT
jgi:LPXTG-motif cell wall-anchored protein